MGVKIKFDFISQVENVLNRLGMKTKIRISPVLCAIIMIFIGGLSFVIFNAQGNSMNDIYNVRFKNYQHSALMSFQVSQTHAALYKIINWVNAEIDQEQVNSLKKQIYLEIKWVQDQIESALKDKRYNEEEIAIYKQLQKNHVKYKGQVKDVIDMLDIDTSTALLFLETTEEAYLSLLSMFKKLNALENKLSSQAYVKSQKMTHNFKLIFISTLMFSILITLLITLVIGKVITMPLIQLSDFVKSIGETGKFDKRVSVKAKDEVGYIANTLNGLMESLEYAITGITQSMEAMNRGCFDQLVEIPLNGDLQILKTYINGTIKRMDEVLEAMIGIMHSMEEGRFNERLELELEGKFNTFKNRINSSLEQLSSVLMDINL